MGSLSNAQIVRCCLAADYLSDSHHTEEYVWGNIFLRPWQVTALVNTVCSCCSWEGTHINHVIFIK